MQMLVHWAHRGVGETWSQHGGALLGCFQLQEVTMTMSPKAPKPTLVRAFGGSLSLKSLPFH